MVSLRPRRQSPAEPPPLVSSGLLVPAYYAAQARTSFASDAEAVAHYTSTGRDEGLLPNPVHDFDRVPLPDVDADDVVTRSARWPIRESFDRAEYLRLVPSSVEHSGGPAGHFLRAQSAGGTAFGLRQPDGGTVAWAETLRIARARGRHLKAVLAADAFDRELYEAQIGRTFASDAAAVWHYLERGEDAGLTPTTAYAVPDASAPDLDPGASRFARSVRRGDLDEPVDASTRSAMLAALRSRHVTPLPVIDPWTPPTIDPPSVQSDLTVTVLLRAADLTREGVKLIAGLSAQTHEDWELVVGLHPYAPGRVRSRVARLAAADERVRVVEVDDSLCSTDVLLDIAEGDVVAWWDGASHWHPRFLDQGLAGLAEGAPVVSAGVLHGTELDASDPQRQIIRPAGDVATLLAAGPRGVRGVLATRAEAARGPDPLAGVAEAWEWLIDAAGRQAIGAVPLIAVAGAPAKIVTADADGVRARHEPRAISETQPGTTSVVLPAVGDLTRTADSIRTATEDGAEAIVVVDRTSSVVPLLRALAAEGVDASAVRLVHLSAPATLGLSLLRAIDAASGDTCVLLLPQVRLVTGDVGRLRSALTDGVVAASAVVLADDATIVSAGVVAAGRSSAPHRLLAGHPGEDVPELDHLAFGAAEGHALAVRTITLRAVRVNGGLDDWAVVDATARATADGGRVRVVSEVRVSIDGPTPPPPDPATAPWRPVDANPPTVDLAALVLQPSGWAVADDTSAVPVLHRAPRLVTHGPATGLPALRWALKLPTPAGARGPVWGDTFFANDLARALRGLGQEVVTDRRTAHYRSGSSHLDDVVLNVRGLRTYRPQPGVTSILWVISHPDLVEGHELEETDLAYAASIPWAQRATESSGRLVAPLLQAADTSRFHPGGAPSDEASPGGIVFVGRPRRGSRKVVTDAIATGATLDLYGEGWSKVVDARHIGGEFVPNDQLPDLYRRARIVLNDHWPDMAAEGFWSNRTFEAAASGALVVSDDVLGGTDLFGGLVRGYQDIEELAALLDPASDSWPPPHDRAAATQRLALDHSFDARARTLLADVLDVRGVDHHLKDPRS